VVIGLIVWKVREGWRERKFEDGYEAAHDIG
jgi:hypothetical protein